MKDDVTKRSLLHPFAKGSQAYRADALRFSSLALHLQKPNEAPARALMPGVRKPFS